MQRQQQDQTPNMFSPESFRNTLNWLSLVALAGSVTLEVFFRKGFGSRYLHLQAGLGALLILLWPALFPHDAPEPMALFFLGYLLMLARARSENRALMATGRQHCVHSRYNGEPRLIRWMPKAPESFIKGYVEPFAAIGLGVALSALNQPLGCYLVFAGLCMRMNQTLMEARDNTRTLDMRDMLIEQQLAAARLRRHGW